MSDDGDDDMNADKVVPIERKGRSRRGRDKPKDVGTLTMMLERYVLLYGTRTVFDREKHIMLPLDALAAAYPQWTKAWKESPDRQMVDADAVVFEPAHPVGDGKLNLWRGWPLTPKKGDCGLVLDLLAHLTNDNEASQEWILKWIAMPLQNPGAKMRTSIIMHGDEGSGKNLFWEIVKAIYGPYGTVINQDQLEDRFNGWISGKLFGIADEVVSRQEMRHHKGRLKSYITSLELIVNEKHLPARAEKNHLNLVFLSNEVQPLVLDESDRRYHVEWTPPKRERSFYDQVATQAYANGGVEAFYRFLLDLPLEGFDEHTQPSQTAAKQRLIEISRPSAQQFWHEWSTDALPVPFVPVKVSDLFSSYQRWCHVTGERFPLRQGLFSREIERFVPKAVKWIAGQKQATMFMVNADLKPEDKVESEWLKGCVESFTEKLAAWKSS